MDTQGHTLTYDDLSSAIESFATFLQGLHIQRGCKAAILLEKSIAGVIAIHAARQLKVTYIPVDVHLPEARRQQILSDCAPHVVIHAQAELFPEHTSHTCVIAEMEQVCVTELPQPENAADRFTEDVAYILYTSGSTGIPKGVCVSPSAADAFVDWCTATFDIREGDNIASIAPFHFDLSVFDLFATLRKKATLHLFRTEDVQNMRAMSVQLAARKINTVYATPTFFSALLEFGKIDKQDWASLRNVLFAGEVFQVQPLHALLSQWNTTRFFNLYGPTETNVCTYTEITREENRTVPYPIGACCAHHEIEITAEGELLVGGPHVANGYLHRDVLTQEKFFTKNNMRWFRTGDRVAMDANGLLVYKGRIDRMVKRRGYRIEPGDIESALHMVAGITGAAVLAQEVNETVLLAAVITTDGSRAFDIVQLKTELLKQLPDYMLPDSVVTVNAFPKTSSGKIDYVKLRQETVSSL